MKNIGIVYAISRAAGEHCKKLIYQNAADKVDILTHEYPAEAYKAAVNDINQIAKLIIKSIDYLYKNNARVIIIAANSVHRAFHVVNEHVKKVFPEVILISIIDTTLEDLKSKKFKTVSIFGSSSTINSGIYQNKLSEEKITTLPVTLEDQSFINSLISSGVSPDAIKQDAKQKVIEIAQKLKKSGCEAIILACTELPLIFNIYNLGISVIDTSHTLALTAVKAAMNHSNSSYG